MNANKSAYCPRSASVIEGDPGRPEVIHTRSPELDTQPDKLMSEVDTKPDILIPEINTQPDAMHASPPLYRGTSLMQKRPPP